LLDNFIVDHQLSGGSTRSNCTAPAGFGKAEGIYVVRP
jgi:hypothetical protein